MKARIFTTAVLMIVALATQAQTSRRSEREKQKSTQNQEKKENVKKSDNKEVDDKKNSRREYTPVNNQKDNKGTNSSQTGQSRRVDNDRSDNRKVDNRGNDRNKSNNSDNRNNNSFGKSVVNHSNQRGHREYVQINRSPRRVVVVNHPRHYSPRPIEVRRVSHPYRIPVRSRIIWSINLHNDFRIFYPEVRYWRYETGYRLPSVSAYDAIDYVGDVATVYGRVFEVYREFETDDYFLYFGDYYPYHDFSVIIPGHEARSISRRPERFFERANIAVTGYITESDYKPEIVVRRASQLDMY